MKNICEQAALYFYGEMEQAQISAFEKHLAECAACRQELAFLKQMQEALEPAAAPSKLVQQVLIQPKPVSWWRKLYKPVLAGMLVLGIGVWGTLQVANTRQEMNAEQTWLAYVSDDLDNEYKSFMADFEMFEAEF